MPTDPFKEHKKLLATRKQKMSSLVQDIEQHEQERDDASSHHSKFSDPKYSSSNVSLTMYEPTLTMEEESKISKTSSTEKAEKEIEKIMSSDLDHKKKNKGKTTKIATTKPAGPTQRSKPHTPAKPTETRRESSAGAAAQKEINKMMEITDKAGPSRIPLGPSKDPTRLISTARSATSASSTNSGNQGFKSIMKPRQRISDLLDGSIKNKTDDDDDSNEEQGFLHIIEALTCFENTQYIFMQRLLDYVDLEAAGVNFKTDVDLAYQIINFDGQLLFLMQQKKIKCTGFVVYSKKSFENVLYDIHGNKVLKFIGPSVFMSRMTSKMLVTDANDRTLGYIKAFGTKVNYSVYNAIGERLFLVVSNLYIPSTSTDFTILCRGQKIGIIKFGWKHVFHEVEYIDYETSGLEIPPEMDEREKALLLGCLMLIEFFWYSPLTRLKLSLLFVGIFIIILAIIVLCIPFIVDNPDDDKITKSYYVPEKIEPPKVAKKENTNAKNLDTGGGG